jgi:signal transduction histidine kinase
MDLYQPISFRSTWSGSFNPLLPGWVLLILAIVPLGLVSAMPHAPVAIGGVAFDFFLFLPLVLCVPITLWAGYPWGAVPAWFASFAMAVSAGVPLTWAAMYAFVAPTSLAVYTLAYRAVPVRIDLRSVPSLLFFVLASMVAAVVHSSGAFLFNTGIETTPARLYAQWQSWWTGSIASLIFGAGPLVLLGSLPVAALKRRRDLGQQIERGVSKPVLFVTFWIAVVAIFSFLFAIHSFVAANITRSLTGIESAVLLRDVQDALEGHHLLHVAMAVLLVISCLFWYQIVVRWTAQTRERAEVLSDDNSRLKTEVSQRRIREDQLQQQTVDLEAANAAKDRFFGIISHDLRSPMGSIVSVSSFLSDHFEEHDPDTFRELLTVVHRSAERVYGLLENMLEWARLQVGTVGAVPESFDMSELLEAVHGLLRRTAETKGIELINDIPEGVTATADLNMIRSVLMNLVNNGIKYSERGDTVTSSVQTKGDTIEVSVSDTGVGMTQTQLANLFTIDERTSTPGTSSEPGAGLGLLICHELLNRNGSTLTATSQPGGGTCFTFSVPAAKAEPDPSRASRRSTAADRGAAARDPESSTWPAPSGAKANSPTS